MNSQPAVILEDVFFSYNQTAVLQNVNLVVSEKEFVWVVGPNGGGKTTLLKIISGLLKPRTGRVMVFGESAWKSRLKIGYLPQQTQLDLHFPVIVLEVALMGCLNRGVKPGPYSSTDRSSALRALESVGLSNQAYRPVGQLSGGQHRRLLIARALACQPQLLLLDEPTANLDREIEQELQSLLKELSQQLTIIMVSHDPTFVSDYVERVVCVDRTVAVHQTADLGLPYVEALYGTQMRMVRHDRQLHGKTE
jgi:zinc transport system ATP-binding protein